MSEPFFDPNDSEGEETYFSRIAAAQVQKLAPVPNPVPADYYDLAAAAEYVVYNHLTQTSGASVSSEGVNGISSSYTDIQKIKDLVAPIMGAYYTDPGRTPVPIQRPYYRRIPYFIYDPLDLKGPFY